MNLFIYLVYYSVASQLELIVGQCDVVFLSRCVTVCHWGTTCHSVSSVEWDVYLTTPTQERGSAHKYNNKSENKVSKNHQ